MMFWLQCIALMGMHYFQGAPQLRRSRCCCCLIELDEWTVTWTKQVDPSPPPPKQTPADSNCTWTRTRIHTNADMHKGQCTYTSSSKGECVQLQGETWHKKKRGQLSSRQMTWDVGGLVISPAEVWIPAAVGRWQLVSSSPAPLFMPAVHFKAITLIKTLLWTGEGEDVSRRARMKVTVREGNVG